MATAVSGSTSVVTPVGNARSETRTCPPMVSALDVRLEGSGDGAGERVDGEGEHLLLDEAVAVVHLGRLTHQRDRHVRADDFVTPDDDEVDVGDRLRHRVALHLAGDRQIATRTRVEREELVRPGLAVQGDPQLAGADRDGQRIGAVAVDDTGNLALTPQPANGARALRAPNLGCEYDFGHNGSPQGGNSGRRGRRLASGERPSSVAARRGGDPAGPPDL